MRKPVPSQVLSNNYTIQTPRLSIVPFASQHLHQRYVDWLNDPEVVRFSEQRRRHHTLASCRQYWRSFRGSPHFFWAIEVRAEGKADHIGTATAYVDVHTRTADIGILLGDKRAWGKGYGLEAWQAVLRYLLLQRDVDKVTAGTLASNVPMVKIMRRSGMTLLTGELKQREFEGRKVPIVQAELSQASLQERSRGLLHRRTN